MDQRKFPEPIEAIILIIVIFGVILIGTLGYGALLMLTGEMDFGFEDAKYLYILGALPFIILPVIYVRIRQYDGSALFRFKTIPSYTLVLSILIGLSLTIVGDELDRIVQMVLPLPDFLIDQLDSMKANSLSDWFWLFIGVVIFAALSEEMVFRGFLQVTLERRGDATRAVLMSSLAWTMIHLNPWWAVQIFIMGVIIGFLAWQTGSIIPGIIVHAINNFISMLYLNFKPELDWYDMGDHVSPLIFLPALAILVYSIKNLSEFYRGRVTSE